MKLIVLILCFLVGGLIVEIRSMNETIDMMILVISQLHKKTEGWGI